MKKTRKIKLGGATVPCISLFGLWVALAIGNFVYQVFAGCNWLAAVERSWFQLAAFVTLWVWQKATRQNAPGEGRGIPRTLDPIVWQSEVSE